jgi:excinuclease ABC subunit C
VASGLDDVPGIGPARRKALLRRFGSVEQIRQAPLDELMQVEGLSRTLAERLQDHLRG